MKGANFVASIVKKIEGTWPDVIAFASAQNYYWEICVSDYDTYTIDKRFKTLTKAWHAAAAARGTKVVFVFCKPNEAMLTKLMKADNLIMNVNS